MSYTYSPKCPHCKIPLQTDCLDPYVDSTKEEPEEYECNYCENTFYASAIILWLVTKGK